MLRRSSRASVMALFIALAARSGNAQQATLEETKYWILSNVPELANAAESVRSDGQLFVTRRDNARSRFDNCTFVIGQRWLSLSSISWRDTIFNEVVYYDIPLSSVSVAGIRVGPNDQSSRGQLEQAATVLFIPMVAGRTVTERGSGEQTSMPIARVWVRDRTAGERLAAAVSRAAVLCGARREPF